MSTEETANDRRTGQRRAVKPGEWACIDAKCANINSEKRTSCEVCGKAKPRAKNKVGREIGKDAADKSKGLFSAEDWVCTKCGNVNWARRSTCNICNAPKLGDLEVRTGYGGGFMDRQDVEYIDRDFDEEFDEFGRKKKKRRLHDEDDRNKQEDDTDEDDDDVDVAKYKLDEENESEEDEGDDDELDKYDLTADPEIAEIKIDISKFKKLDEYDMETRASSVASSECSCSCSGGECSCEDSECEDLKKHESKREIEKSTKQSHEHDRENDSREKERDRSRDRHREKGKHGDRKERERDRDRNGRSRSRERDRDRNGRSRSHDRDHRRSRERKRSKDRDHRK